MPTFQNVSSYRYVFEKYVYKNTSSFRLGKYELHCTLKEEIAFVKRSITILQWPLIPKGYIYCVCMCFFVGGGGMGDTNELKEEAW